MVPVWGMLVGMGYGVGFMVVRIRRVFYKTQQRCIFLGGMEYARGYDVTGGQIGSESGCAIPA